MKIIETIPALASGGGERFVVDLCNELSNKHDVTLVVLQKLEGECAFYLSQVSKRVKVVSFCKKNGFDFRLFYRFLAFIKEEKPDIIHTHLRAIVYALLAELFVVRGVHTIHSEASKEACEWFSRVVRKLLFKTKRVIPVTISEESHRSFVDFYGFGSRQIDNGRDIPKDIVVSASVKREMNKYRMNDKTRIIVQLAHIDKVKRQDLMARVAHRLYDEGYNFSVLFIGRCGNYVEKVKNEMSENCFLLGERENPLEYLKEANALALCSSYEGLPISLIEALGVGVVPICTPVGGIVNVIKSGENGILSKDISEESYYRAIKGFLEMSDDEIKTMSGKALESYAPYSMKECAAKYIDLFRLLSYGKSEENR